MSLSILLQGFIIGIFVAAPVGPVGVLCIQRSVTRGKRHGFISGLGAATADAAYAAVAAFGLTFISSFIEQQQFYLRLGGGLLLCFLGVRLAMKRPTRDASPLSTIDHIHHYSSTVLLTLTNPMTFVAFAALFAGLNLVESEGTSQLMTASLLVAGVFLGSSFWWLVLSLVSGAFKERLTHLRMVWVNRIAGIVVAVFGLCVLGSVFVWGK
jgi:threonine/homoserine/homoserine lactone efflux protein